MMIQWVELEVGSCTSNTAHLTCSGTSIEVPAAEPQDDDEDGKYQGG
jgi:hypothetical protein